MAKQIFNVMDDYFGEALKQSPSYEQAYERAIDKFMRVHGVECPLTYGGYRRRVYRDKKHK
jgi:hypothetical protein